MLQQGREPTRWVCKSLDLAIPRVRHRIYRPWSAKTEKTNARETKGQRKRKLYKFCFMRFVQRVCLDY